MSEIENKKQYFRISDHKILRVGRVDDGEKTVYQVAQMFSDDVLPTADEIKNKPGITIRSELLMVFEPAEFIVMLRTGTDFLKESIEYDKLFGINGE